MDFLELLSKINIKYPTDITFETTSKWHETTKEILVNSIIKSIFEFTFKYMRLLQINNNMFSAKNTWEKTYFYQDENLNYPAIKRDSMKTF